MKKRCFVVALILGLSLPGCSNNPLGGNIFSQNEEDALRSSSILSLVATPTRREYAIDTTYRLGEELRVLAVYVGGYTRAVPVEDVEVSLDTLGVVGSGFWFSESDLGERKFTVLYGNQSVFYYAIVRDPDALPGTGSSESGSGDTGMNLGFFYTN
jgi:hypothetical protein